MQVTRKSCRNSIIAVNNLLDSITLRSILFFSTQFYCYSTWYIRNFRQILVTSAEPHTVLSSSTLMCKFVLFQQGEQNRMENRTMKISVQQYNTMDC